MGSTVITSACTELLVQQLKKPTCVHGEISRLGCLWWRRFPDDSLQRQPQRRVHDPVFYRERFSGLALIPWGGGDDEVSHVVLYESRRHVFFFIGSHRHRSRCGWTDYCVVCSWSVPDWRYVVLLCCTIDCFLALCSSLSYLVNLPQLHTRLLFPVRAVLNSTRGERRGTLSLWVIYSKWTTVI